MKVLKEILGRIFALWALLVLTVTMVAVAPAMWMIGFTDEPKRTVIFHRISTPWMRIFFALTGCTLKVKGEENFKQHENYIVICNHNSFMDIPISTPFIPGANKTIAKVELSRVPLFGFIYKRGSILVDRKDKASRGDSFRKMKEVLAIGMHMCIYPEGTRNKTSEPLKAFHDGAFRLAVDTHKALLPALIFNTRKVLPTDKVFFFWPSRMELHFLAPVQVNEADTAEGLKLKLYNLMSSYYAANL